MSVRLTSSLLLVLFLFGTVLILSVSSSQEETELFGLDLLSPFSRLLSAAKPETRLPPTVPVAKEFEHSLDEPAEKLKQPSALSNFAKTLTDKILHFPRIIHGHQLKEQTDVPGLIREYGYQVETHEVKTVDGYLLNLHRIPPAQDGKPHPVVYLQHGLLDSSATWVLSDNGSLAFILADAGYDVWLGNSRGNIYGSRHVTLDVNSEQFWAFSWDHMAQFDLPASLEKVLGVSGADDLTYVGHSQGCTIALALLGGFPEWEPKINLFISLAPAPFLGHVKLHFMKGLSLLPESSFKILFGKKVFTSSSNDIPFHSVCPISPAICHNVLCLLCGCNSTASVPMGRVSFLLKQFPAGTSVQNMIHYTQTVKSGKFRKFDYGLLKNMQVYGSPVPPVYNIGGIKTPMIFFYGSEDMLADDVDVEFLISQVLPPLKAIKLSYGHGDFVWAPSATDLIYRPMLTLIQKYRVRG